MSLFRSEEVSRILTDFNTILKYMPFLEEHGFSEFGKGQLMGKMELLKEGLSDPMTSHPEQRSDSRIKVNQVDSNSFHDYEEVSVKTPVAPSIGTSNFNDDEKYLVGGEIDERTSENNSLDQYRKRKYLTENNRWNFKNEVETSWISRIKKLADI